MNELHIKENSYKLHTEVSALFSWKVIMVEIQVTKLKVHIYLSPKQRLVEVMSSEIARSIQMYTILRKNLIF